MSKKIQYTPQEIFVNESVVELIKGANQNNFNTAEVVFETAMCCLMNFWINNSDRSSEAVDEIMNLTHNALQGNIQYVIDNYHTAERTVITPEGESYDPNKTKLN